MELVEGHNRKIFKPMYLLQVLLVHVLALWVLWNHFNPWLAGISVVLGLTMAYGMGIFHHMQFTHGSFRCVKWVSWLGGLWGTLTWRGPMAPPVKYAAMHAVHHVYADTPLDPHTPTQGLFHAFMSWFWNVPYGLDKPEQYLRYAPKWIKQDAVLMWMDRHTDLLQLQWAVLSFVAGYFIDGFDNPWLSGLVFVAYFVGCKTVVVLWGANAVDVINHTRGYRNYETNDQSTNSFLMAAIHLGGAISWHNNHHAEPDYFSVRKQWWELDVHHWFLIGLSKLGLVWDIRIKDDVAVTAK